MSNAWLNAEKVCKYSGGTLKLKAFKVDFEGAKKLQRYLPDTVPLQVLESWLRKDENCKLYGVPVLWVH